ncbi:hypothetical protein [Cognatilysobacter bugurensis]|uniref:hypothetical protein n=1 Tax=Cognatilysobacter bugurensis TaxID=543356 RepID=UPI0016755E6C|nr:hypothetical protein [Lysobacter bugurensis]
MAPAVVVAILLAVFAWHPAGLPRAIAEHDKIAHLVGFAALALTLRAGLPQLSRAEYAGALLLAASAVELGQTFIASRTGSLADIAAGAVGAIFGLMLADAWGRRRSIAALFDPASAVHAAVVGAREPSPGALWIGAVTKGRRRSGLPGAVEERQG